MIARIFLTYILPDSLLQRVFSLPRLRTLVGDGTGGFTQVATYTVSGNALAVGDFNSDGKQDFASAPLITPGRVSICNGFGTGTYAAPVDTPTGNDPRDVKAAPTGRAR